MGERTTYTPGTFSWTDLTTPDQHAAKPFYTELFGWEAQDEPAGEDVVYSLMLLGGHRVAAISPQPEQQRDAGVPPTWNTYITVDSADEVLRQARGLGGTVHAPAFDVLDAGRMGVIQDPQGAYLLLWEPRSVNGAELVNAPGALSWNELVTPDMEASADFYGQLLGWTATPVEGGGMPYMTITGADGRTIGGMRAATETEPTYWLVYFGCEEIAGALERVEELGGRALMEPMSMPTGSIAAVTDPQGAVFTLYAGNFDP